MNECHPYRPLTADSKSKSKAEVLHEKFTESYLKLANTLYEEALLKAEAVQKEGKNSVQVESESAYVMSKVRELLAKDGFALGTVYEQSRPAPTSENWTAKKTVYYFSFSF